MDYKEPDYIKMAAGMADAVADGKMGTFGVMLADAEIDNAKQRIMGCADTLSKAKGVANRGMAIRDMRAAYDDYKLAMLNGQRAMNEVNRNN